MDLPEILKNELKGIKAKVPLARYTTFRIGGPASFFYSAKSNDLLVKSIKLAIQEKVPYFLLSGGSNVLVSDTGFDGLVIKADNQNFQFTDNTLEADSGVILNKLVAEGTKRGLSGLEWAAGIPGTVGGAIRGNAGAKDGEMKDIVDWVEVVKEDGDTINMSSKDCQFKYRDSLFKNKDLIIISAKLNLEQDDQQQIQQRVASNLKNRLDTQPFQEHSAGCIFKNPEGASAGQLIDQAGLKGKKIGGAEVSDKHANFIVNTGKATAEQVVMLIGLIKQKIRNQHNIQLQEEIEYIGFDN
ncbi:MAG: UDP-N-acetylmuramate dehydrogenase [Patescibacteria group bacterium]